MEDLRCKIKDKIFKSFPFMATGYLAMWLLAIGCLFLYTNYAFAFPENIPDAFTLEDLVDHALQKNPKLLASGEFILAQQNKISEARANKKFQLSLNNTVTFIGVVAASTDTVIPPLFPGGQTVVIPGQEFSEKQIYDIKFVLRKPLYTSRRLENLVRQAKLAESYAKLDKKRLEEEIALQTRLVYFSVVRARNVVMVAEKSVKQAEEHLRISTSRLTAGTAPKFEVLQSDVQLTQVKQNLEKAKNSLRLSILTLSQVLATELTEEQGLNLVRIIEKNRLTKKWPYMIEETVSMALKNRKEIALMALTEETNKVGTLIVKTGKKPDLSMLVDYGLKKGNKLPSEFRDDWNINLVLAMPIYDGGLTKARARGQKASVSQTGFNLKDVTLAITLEAKQAYLKLQDAMQSIEAQKKLVSQYLESLRLAEVRYKAGVGTNLDVLDAQTALTSAENSLYQAQFDYEEAIARLEKATGSSVSQ